MDTVYFRETQQFRQPWLWGLLLVLSAVVFASMREWFADLVSGGLIHPGEFAPAIGPLIMLGVILLFLLMRLETAVDEEGIHYRFYPFQFQWTTISPKEIASWRIRTYSPLAEYGGWGIRFGLGGQGMALNVSGNVGLQLEQTSNRKLLIGTQRPAELKEAMERLMAVEG
jgi:hypothetical protein